MLKITNAVGYVKKMSTNVLQRGQIKTIEVFVNEIVQLGDHIENVSFYI